MTVELTPEQVRRGFIRATTCYANAPERWLQRAATGRTDEQLAEDLAYELGEEGAASSWNDIPSYHVKRAGLQIWLDADFARPHRNPPTFKGAATIAMARTVFGIRNAADKQMDLFRDAP